MILKSYFDGANQADSAQFDVVTLASISGTNDQLRLLNADWKAALQRHNAPWLHTTDLFSRMKEPFTEKNGWDSAKSEGLILDCVEAIKRHVARPLTDASPRVGLLPFTVSIALKDFIKAREGNPEVPNSASETCATQA